MEISHISLSGENHGRKQLTGKALGVVEKDA